MLTKFLDPDYMPEKKYKPEYCDDMVKLMSKGYTNLELAAEFNVNEKTFYEWRKTHKEFDAAWHEGYPKCFKWWMTIGKNRFLKTDKGMKFWSLMVSNMFGLSSNDVKTATTNHIQIGNVNVLKYNDKSEQELLEIFNNKLTKNKDRLEALMERSNDLIDETVIDISKELPNE